MLTSARPLRCGCGCAVTTAVKIAADRAPTMHSEPVWLQCGHRRAPRGTPPRPKVRQRSIIAPSWRRKSRRTQREERSAQCAAHLQRLRHCPGCSPPWLRRWLGGAGARRGAALAWGGRGPALPCPGGVAGVAGDCARGAARWRRAITVLMIPHPAREAGAADWVEGGGLAVACRLTFDWTPRAPSHRAADAPHSLQAHCAAVVHRAASPLPCARRRPRHTRQGQPGQGGLSGSPHHHPDDVPTPTSSGALSRSTRRGHLDVPVGGSVGLPKNSVPIFCGLVFPMGGRVAPSRTALRRVSGPVLLYSVLGVEPASGQAEPDPLAPPSPPASWSRSAGRRASEHQGGSTTSWSSPSCHARGARRPVSGGPRRALT